jgi:ribosomal-protein-alanine N-acetyltransferase
MSSRDIWVGLAKHTLLDLERILLRPFTFDDVQDVYSYSSDEATTEFVFERHEDTSVTEEYITSNMREPLGRFAIEDKKTGHVIGQIALANIDFENNSAECSYTLHRGYWGTRYDVRSDESCFEYCFCRM